MRKILITGATGFVGRALCKRMLADGWQVLGTVRSAGLAVTLPTGVDFIQIRSIGETTDWSKALGNIDTVVHLAARVHVMQDNVSDPLAAFREVNLKGTERLARSAVSRGVRRFIYMSSVGIHGNRNHGTPFTEQDLPAPYSPYTLSRNGRANWYLPRLQIKRGLRLL